MRDRRSSSFDALMTRKKLHRKCAARPSLQPSPKHASVLFVIFPWCVDSSSTMASRARDTKDEPRCSGGRFRYLGRPETDQVLGMAMNLLGGGLYDADRFEDALSVQEAELSMTRRLGASEESILATQSNIASTYQALGRIEEALNLYRDVYSAELKLFGRQNRQTLSSANNYAMTLLDLRRFEEAKKVLRKVTPVARRILGTEHELSLSLREDLSRATLDGESSAEEKRQALRMLEDVAGVMRRVLGPAHPDTLHAQEKLDGYRK